MAGISRKQLQGGLTNEEIARLGFKEMPFSLSADPRFLFLSAQHNAALTRVSDDINFRQGLAVVEGDIGVGKTTLARRLYDIHYMDSEFNVIFLHTARYSTPLELARAIATGFKLPVKRAYIKTRESFESFLVEERHQERNVVAIIDDAQSMSPESLNAIWDLYNFDAQVKLIQIILFGQPEIHNIFAANPPVLQRVASWQKLSPLPPDDAFSMITFRVQVAGRSTPLLSDDAFEVLYQNTKGVPRTIIGICSEILQIMIKRGVNSADVDVVKAAIEAYSLRFKTGGAG